MPRVKKYAYPPREATVLAIMAAHRMGTRFTTTELIEKAYPRGRVPLAARQSMIGIMNSLIARVDENGEKFRIERTAGMGPVPHQFWKEARR